MVGGGGWSVAEDGRWRRMVGGGGWSVAEDGRWRRRVTEEAAKEAGRGGEVRQVAMAEREDSHAADCVWLLQSAPWPLAPDPWPHRLACGSSQKRLLRIGAYGARGQGPGTASEPMSSPSTRRPLAPGDWPLPPAPCPLATGPSTGHWPLATGHWPLATMGLALTSRGWQST